MAREGIPSAVLLDALGTLVELETAMAAPGRRAGRARRRGGRGGRARGDAGRDGLLPRPPRRGERRGRALKDLRRRCAARRAGAPRHARCRWPTSRTPCWRRSASAPTPRCPPCSGACARPARGWPWSPTGTSRCTTSSSARTCARWSTPSSSRPCSASPSPIRRSSAPRSSAWGPSAAEAIHVGDSVEHDVAGARAAGVEAVLVARNGGAGTRRRARRHGARRAPDDVGHTCRLVALHRASMSTAPSSIPPPSFDVAPELPEGVERPPRPEAPRWKPWMAWVGLVGAFAGALIGALIVGVIGAAAGSDFAHPTPAVNISATIVQDLSLHRRRAALRQHRRHAAPGAVRAAPDELLAGRGQRWRSPSSPSTGHLRRGWRSWASTPTTPSCPTSSA